MPNKRVYFACEQVQILPDGVETGASQYIVHGVQSAGSNVNFNLEPIFELGQVDLYENIENLADVEVTLEKVLDGYCPIFLMATAGSPSATLVGRSTAKCTVGFSVFSDVQDSASGNPIAEVVCSGMFPGAVSYTFPVEGNATESVTLLGNNRINRIQNASAALMLQHPGLESGVWKFVGQMDNTDSPLSLSGSGGVNRREDMLFAVPGLAPTLDVNGQVVYDRATILPTCIRGISSSGTNDRLNGDYGAHVQDISVSTDYGRDNLFEQGRRNPYHRMANFPIEVTCEVNILATDLDLVSASDAGVVAGTGSNLKNYSIQVKMREGLLINLGTKNKLASVSYSGGDAGGGNVSATYSFTNNNNCTVTHPADVTAALRIDT